MVDPGGVTEISRGLSDSETPDRISNDRLDPGGVTEIAGIPSRCARPSSATPPGSAQGCRPDTGGIAGAQPPANFLDPSGVKSMRVGLILSQVLRNAVPLVALLGTIQRKAPMIHRSEFGRHQRVP